jgi:CheY-like chemotaxis protein
MNAAEAIRKEGRILVATHNVELDKPAATRFGELAPGRYVRLAVEDTGCGMSPETASRAFEPFFSTKGQGRGLALAAVYGIVRNHDGQITVSSEEGRGTTVELYFPTIERLSRKERLSTELGSTESSRAILVIDDEEVVRQVMQTILERAGYEVLTAVNGPEAIEIARTHSGPIHAALLDMDMPIMDATQVLPLLKKVRPSMRVIICSGYTLDAVARNLLKSGAESFLAKPFRPEALEAEIRRVLGG